jgi:hypothetical protein
MPDWNTRLAVSYTDTDGNTVAITPIDSFSPTFALNAEALHSVEATHIGVIFAPEGMTFTMTVKAIGDVAAKLTALALKGAHFDVILQETDDGDDWSFKSVVMTRCLITSAAPSAAAVSGAPTATFSGFSLGAKAEDKVGHTVQIP